ncbi:MAG: hypothetical protein J2P36_38310, partial [Ktedonobacteraceae bacterium]|nr:hypothetical protein [Ktedonobacteraceae bacterium]
FAQVGPLPASSNIWSSDSLDGLAYLQTFSATEPRPQSDPNAQKEYFQYNAAGDYAAIRWLNTHVQGDPAIIEAVGDDYTVYGRVSAFTGLPAPMGWVGHEYQWRVNWLRSDTAWADFNGRSTDVDIIYSDPHPQNVLAMMARYKAQYLYVGPLEYGKYPNVDLKRFGTFMQVVYDAQGVTIYKVR